MQVDNAASTSHIIPISPTDRGRAAGSLIVMPSTVAALTAAYARRFLQERLSDLGKVLEIGRVVVAGGGFEPPTFGL